MRTPNRTWAALAGLAVVIASLVPSGAAAFCGSEAECGPCDRPPADARIVAAGCCCGDLAAAESAAPEVAEGAVEGELATQGLHAAAFPAQPKVADTSSGSALHTRVHRTPATGPPLFQLYQSLLI